MFKFKGPNNPPVQQPTFNIDKKRKVDLFVTDDNRSKNKKLCGIEEIMDSKKIKFDELSYLFEKNYQPQKVSLKENKFEEGQYFKTPILSLKDAEYFIVSCIC